jgi:hypothetical protein
MINFLAGPSDVDSREPLHTDEVSESRVFDDVMTGRIELTETVFSKTRSTQFI